MREHPSQMLRKRSSGLQAHDAPGGRPLLVARWTRAEDGGMEQKEMPAKAGFQALPLSAATTHLSSAEQRARQSALQCQKAPGAAPGATWSRRPTTTRPCWTGNAELRDVVSCRGRAAGKDRRGLQCQRLGWAIKAAVEGARLLFGRCCITPARGTSRSVLYCHRIA